MHNPQEFLMIWTERPRRHDMVYDQCWFAKSGFTDSDYDHEFKDLLESWKHILQFNCPPAPTRDDNDRDRIELPIAFLGCARSIDSEIQMLLVLCKKYGYNLHQEFSSITNGGKKTRHPWTERRVSLLVFRHGAPVPPWVETKGEFLYRHPKELWQMTLSELYALHDEYVLTYQEKGVANYYKKHGHVPSPALYCRYQLEGEKVFANTYLPGTWKAKKDKHGHHRASDDTLHRNAVEQALKDGKPVPMEVVEDYPDLAKYYGCPVQDTSNPFNLVQEDSVPCNEESCIENRKHHVIDHGYHPFQIIEIRKGSKWAKQFEESKDFFKMGHHFSKGNMYMWLVYLNPKGKSYYIIGFRNYDNTQKLLRRFIVKYGLSSVVLATWLHGMAEAYRGQLPLF